MVEIHFLRCTGCWEKGIRHLPNTSSHQWAPSSGMKSFHGKDRIHALGSCWGRTSLLDQVCYHMWSLYMLAWLWCFSGECEEQIKKSACLQLDEKVRGRALPEGNSKSFCVCCKNRSSSCLHDNRGTCRQGLSCERGLLWNVVTPPVQQHKPFYTVPWRSAYLLLGGEKRGWIVMGINPDVKGIPLSCLFYASGDLQQNLKQLTLEISEQQSHIIHEKKKLFS